MRRTRRDPMKLAVRITSREAGQIIKNYSPRGMFYLAGRTGDDRRVIVGIDNRTGHAWTEEFTSLLKCLKWLHG